MSIFKISTYENLPSGGAKNLYDLVIGKLKEDHNVREFSCNYPQSTKFIKYYVSALFDSKKCNKRISKKISSSDVLLAHQDWITKSPWLLRYANIPTFYICHEPPREFYDKELIGKLSTRNRLINMLRLPIKYIDRQNIMINKNIVLVSNSKFARKLIYNAYKLDSKVIYPCIDQSEIDKNHKNFNKSKQNQVISVGAITPSKRQDFLIRVIANVPKQNRPKLILIGNGADSKYHSKLEALAKNLNVDIKIAINISRKNLIDYYFESKAFIYAPINEPFGLVVLEAMYCGLPIICYKGGGGYAEVLTNNNGEVINSLNINTWSKSLIKITNNYNYYAEINKKTARIYNVENYKEKLIEIISRNIQ